MKTGLPTDDRQARFISPSYEGSCSASGAQLLATTFDRLYPQHIRTGIGPTLLAVLAPGHWHLNVHGRHQDVTRPVPKPHRLALDTMGQMITAALGAGSVNRFAKISGSHDLVPSSKDPIRTNSLTPFGPLSPLSSPSTGICSRCPGSDTLNRHPGYRRREGRYGDYHLCHKGKAAMASNSMGQYCGGHKPLGRGFTARCRSLETRPETQIRPGSKAGPYLVWSDAPISGQISKKRIGVP